MMNRLFLFLLFFLIFSQTGFAWTEKALDSSDPFVFTPNQMSIENFYLDTQEDYSWIPGSFEWVRVDRQLLIPRARVKLKLTPGSVVHYQGRTMVATTDSLEFLVVLSQEGKNLIEVNQKKIPVRFKLNGVLDTALIVDTSCSNAPLQFQTAKLKHSWAFVYCHVIHTKNLIGQTSQYDVQLVWESEEEKAEAKLNQKSISSLDGLTYQLTFAAESGPLTLKKGEDEIIISPAVPKFFHPLSVSFGFGPYSNQDILRPFITLYAAYYFNEQMKLASFTAFPIKARPEIDQGLYVISEQFRGLDERMIVSLLLGGHVLNFSSQGSNYFKWSAPQGAEFSFRDLFEKGKSGSFGIFFYPEISNRSYVNTWIRYGNGKFFWELNYISWKEAIPNGSYSSKSYGLSVGLPLFKAL